MKASSTRSRLARATAPGKRARAIEKNTGLSMAAHAQVVVDPTEAEEALLLLMLKYPKQNSIPPPIPTPADVRIFCVTPMVISVLDYSKGFGHTDLVDLCASTDRRPLE